MLVRSIISQQISLGAARAIRNRLEQLVAPEKVTPESLLRFSPDQLRSAGLSPQKTAYSAENKYIQSAVLDGKPLDKPWFYHRELVDGGTGGTLELQLGPEPNRTWGSRKTPRHR